MALGIEKISTELVGTTLGTSSRDVGTLCTHSAINKWSKWKPVIYNKLTGLVLSDLQSIKFGLTTVSEITPILLLDKIASLGYSVKYDMPTGGASSPFRLGDFRNYMHDAVIPGGTSNTGITVKIEKGSARYNNTSWKYIYTGIEVAENDYNVELGELFPAGVYRGIMLTNGTTSYWKTGDIDWVDPLIKMWTGTTRAFQFYTNKEQTTLRGGTSADNDAIFYAMPTDSDNQNPYNLNVTDDFGQGSIRYNLTIQAAYSSIDNMVSYTVRFDARSYEAGGGNLSNIYIRLYQGETQLAQQSKGAYNLADGTYVDYIDNFPTVENTNLKVAVIENNAEQGRVDVIISN